MLSKINSCAIKGIDAYIVEVETHGRQYGLFQYCWIFELKLASIRNEENNFVEITSGYSIVNHTTINLYC